MKDPKANDKTTMKKTIFFYVVHAELTDFQIGELALFIVVNFNNCN